MLDTTQENFSRDVLDASHEAPVLVDFWAPWCGPCRTLSPLLAQIEAESRGRLKIVKVNVDENQELSARFGVRSIPYVVAFVAGQPVDSFVGVLPAEGLRQFVGRLLPDPADLQARLDLANALVARRDYEPALEQLLAIVERDRAFGDDAGRRLMLSVFDLAKDQPQLVSSFRRRLSAALYR